MLYRMTSTATVLQAVEALELSAPAQFSFPNRREVADALEAHMPKTWTPGTLWTPPADTFYPTPRIISTDVSFAPDYLMLGIDLFSARFRKIIERAAPLVRFIEINAAGSSESFLKRDYRAAAFPSLTPFSRVFIDAYLYAGMPAIFKPPMKPGFGPASPIFHVATSAWIMCTRDIVDLVMETSVSGVSFFDYETDEELAPSV